MSFSYIVLGAGRQGTASAYDLARFGDAARVTLADIDRDRAHTAAERVNRLSGQSIADAITLDVRDGDAAHAPFWGGR